jgi:hypothetical protein
MNLARTYRSKRMLRNRVRFNRTSRNGLFRFHKSADFTIDMSGAPRRHRGSTACVLLHSSPPRMSTFRRSRPKKRAKKILSYNRPTRTLTSCTAASSTPFAQISPSVELWRSTAVETNVNAYPTENVAELRRLQRNFPDLFDSGRREASGRWSCYNHGTFSSMETSSKK